jgi:hypothetical protein
MTSPKSPNASPKMPAITQVRPDGEEEAVVEGRARDGAVDRAVEEDEVVEVVGVGAMEKDEEVDEMRLVVEVLVPVVWLVRLDVERAVVVG